MGTPLWKRQESNLVSVANLNSSNQKQDGFLVKNLQGAQGLRDSLQYIPSEWDWVSSAKLLGLRKSRVISLLMDIPMVNSAKDMAARALPFSKTPQLSLSLPLHRTLGIFWNLLV